MKRPLLPVLLLCMASGAGAQNAPDADAWGEPVDGVQLHLGLATSGPPTLPGELPAMEVQIRNQGPVAVVLRPEAILFAKIEIDGIWYAQQIAILGTANPVVIEPGSRSGPYVIRPVASSIHERDIHPARSLELAPGSHRIRVRNAMELSASEFRLAIERSSPGQVVKWTGKDVPALVSNAIVVDIPALSASAERDALIAQASAGGSQGLSAAWRLVEKYPEAAFAPMQKAVAATTAPQLRSEYVRLAGSVPDDLVIPFLQTQIVPAIDLPSRMSAAEALLARGRDEGLWSLLDTWERTDRNRPWLHDTARLLEFLGRSGNPQVIGRLERVSDFSVDVRFAIVQMFLPWPRGGTRMHLLDQGRGTSLPATLLTATMPELPGGAGSTAAIEHLLRTALDDTGAVPMEGKIDDVNVYLPRVCDMAALVLSRRWPAKYQFVWSTDAADRDRQIAVIKAAWRNP